MLTFTRALLDERWLTEVGLKAANARALHSTQGGAVPFWDMTDHLSRFVGGAVPRSGWADSGGMRVLI